MELSHYNTLLQLSVGLNIACIAGYKASTFGKIIETFFTRTNTVIKERVAAIQQKISISQTCYNTEKLGKNESLSALDNELVRTYHCAGFTIDQNNLSKLRNAIDRNCSPKCMSGIATFSTLYAIIQMFLILLDQTNLETTQIFYINALICCIPTIIFILTKAFYIHPLYALIKEAKIPYKVLRKRYVAFRKETKNPIKKIWYSFKICHIERQILRGYELIKFGDDSIENKHREFLYSLKAKICKFLNVKNAVLFSAICLMISIFLDRYLGMPSNLVSVSEYIVIIIAYIPFVIYIYVLYIYGLHRKDVINDYFKDTENKLRDAEILYRTIKDNRPTNFD